MPEQEVETELPIGRFQPDLGKDRGRDGKSTNIAPVSLFPCRWQLSTALELPHQLQLQSVQELGAGRCRDDGCHPTAGYELNGFLVLESDDLWP